MKKLLCLLLVLLMLPTGLLAEEKAFPYNWYEVFVYSYKDSDGDGIGDLKGLISKLDYIKDMGFTGLWLMPIMPSPSYHKYDVTDYCAVDSQYGTLEDMRELVKGLHERGIKLILDLPLNHSSTRHPWFLAATEALKQGRRDHPMVSYYCFQQEEGKGFVPLTGTDWYYEEQFQGGQMPDLNLKNPALLEEIKQIMAFWLRDMDVDGFRLDAVTSFFAGDDQQNIAFLRFLETESERIKPGSYLVGECWKGLQTIADYYQSGIESFFLFPAAQAEGYVAAALRARSPAPTYAASLEKVRQAIPQGILAPFLSNHDTGRTVGLVQGRKAPERVKFAHALLSLMGGHSFTYYGEEIGMLGSGPDPNKRLGMLWDEGEHTKPPPGVTSEEYPYPGVAAQQKDALSILQYIRRMNQQRLKMPAIALGDTTLHEVTASSCWIEKRYGGQSLWIAVNFSAKEEAALKLPAALQLLDSLTVRNEEVSLQKADDSQRVLLPPYGIAFLQAPDASHGGQASGDAQQSKRIARLCKPAGCGHLLHLVL